MGLCLVAVLLSLGLAAGAGTVNAVTALDPGHISVWTQQWPDLPVELSYTNAQETNVIVMLRVNCPHQLTNGTVEVVFPAGFDVTTAYCMQTNCQKQPTIQGQVVVLLGVSIAANTDTTITLGGITNPLTAGGYGPFGIRTRPFPGGQTLDINLAFASVGITAIVGNMKTITVTTPAGVPKTRVPNLSLDFSFILSRDLWRHDTVRITVSKYWTLISPVCTSKLYTGRTTQSFVGEGTGQQLGCTVTAKDSSPNGAQILYIYGLGEDVLVSSNDTNKYVMLEVAGFTSPLYSYPDGFYQWKVETMRCTTRNILERGNILSGPSVNPTDIPSATWTPTWPYPSKSILVGMQMYMDMTFTLPFEVPFGGYIQIVTSGASGNSAWGGVSCYLLQHYQGNHPTMPWVQNSANCAATGAYTIQVSNLPDVAAGSVYTIRNLVTFLGTTVQIASITSYTAEGYGINAGYNLGSITLNSQDYLLNKFDILLSKDSSITSDSGLTGGTSDYSYYLKFRITPNTDLLQSTSRFNISCPFASALDDFRIYFPQDSNTVYQVRKDSNLGFATDFTYTTVSTQTVTSVTNPSITFNTQFGLDYFQLSSSQSAGLNPLDLSTTAGQSVVVGISRKTSGAGMGWPRVASNAATTYECYITIEDTATVSPRTTQRGVAQFTITPRTLFSSSVNYFCTYNLAGAPIYISMQPDLFPIPSSSSTLQYYVEFEFSEPQLNRKSDDTLIDSGTYPPLFGSGLFNHSDYPYDLDDPVNSFQPAILSTLSFQIYSESQKTKLRLTYFDTLVTSQSYAIDFPVGSQVKPGSTLVTIRTYYQVIANPRVKYLHHEQTQTVLTTGTAPNLYSSLSWVFGDFVPNGEQLRQTARFQMQTTTIAVNQNSNWVYIILPRGYTLNNAYLSEGNWDVWNAVGNFTKQHVFTSSNPNFSFPSIVAQCTTNTCVNALAKRSLELYGIKPALGVPCNYKDKITFVVTSMNDKSGVCLAAGTLDHTTLLGDITITQLQPQTVLARGPDAMDITVKVTFRTTHGGESDSWIALTINPEFESIAGVTTCEATGLLPFNSTTPVRCELIGNAVTIDHFANFTATPNLLISLTIKHLLPPASDWSTRAHFISSLLSWTKDGRKIDTIQVTDADLISVKPAEPSGRSSVYLLQTVPLNGRQSLADLYFSFSLPHLIPALAGKITIQSPVPFNYTSGSIKNQCWLSGIEYTSCESDGKSTVTVTFVQAYEANAVVEVYLDGAVSGLQAGVYTSTSFAVTSYWGNAVIDNDLQVDSDLYVNRKYEDHRLAPLSPPVFEIIPVDFSFTPTTAGEIATYSFTFQLTSRLELSHRLWFKFPHDAFDAYVGPAKLLWSTEANTYYVTCSSEEIEVTECSVDHWVVSVQPKLSVEPLRSITVHMQVYNPPSGAGYRIDLFHLTADENALAALPAIAVVYPTSPALNIILKNLTMSSNYLRQDSTATFAFYLTQALNTTSQVQALFPGHYDLFTDSLPCASSYRDTAPGATIKDDQTWNSATSCAVNPENNGLILPPPSTAYSFDASKLIRLAVNVSNPEWADERTGDLLWDFDYYNTLSQPGYEVWTERFQLVVYDMAAKAYTARTYPNLQCGYTGFNSAKLQLKVNSYDPFLNTNRIRVGTGLQTQPIPITAPEFFRSKSVELEAKVSGISSEYESLTVISEDDFMMYETESQLTIRVSADELLTPGLYLVEWTTMETTHSGVSSTLYYPPVKTMVEVYRTEENSVPITLTHTQTIAVGARSVPVKVSLDYPPNTKLLVNLALAEEYSGIEIYPSLLYFLPNQDTAYFEITINSDFDLTSTDQLLLNFWLGGENANLYEIPRWSAVDITGLRTVETLPTIIDWGLQGCTRKTCLLTPAFSVPGVFYWRLAAKSTPELAFKDLMANINRLSDEVVISDEDQYLDRNYLEDFRPASEVDPVTGETWESFQRRLYRAHLMTSYFGRAIQYETSTNLEFNWLWAETEYTLSGYFVDQYEVSSDMLSVNLTTSALASSALVSLVQTPTDLSQEQLKNAVAAQLGVNPARLIYQQYETSLADIAVAADRFVDGQDPTTLAFAASSVGAQGSYAAITRPVGVNITSVSSAVETTSVTFFIVTEASVSEICCTAQPYTANRDTATQIWLGLNSFNEYVPSSCSFSNTTVTIGGLLPGTEYTCQCVAADDYPVWRTLGAPYLKIVRTSELTPAIEQQEEVVPQANGNLMVTEVNAALWGLALGTLLLVAS